MSESSPTAPSEFERKKWQTGLDLRRQELRIKEVEVTIKEREQNRLVDEARRSRWWNPLFIAIVGATITAIASIAVSWWNGRVNEETETLKAESARILEMIKTNDINKAKHNLDFFYLPKTYACASGESNML